MGPNAGVAEKCRWLREAKKIGTSGPIDADGVGLQKPEQASSRGIGRGRSICEYDEIMQIPPGSSDDALLINASSALCNMADHSELEIQKFEPLPHSEIASFRFRNDNCRVIFEILAAGHFFILAITCKEDSYRVSASLT